MKKLITKHFSKWVSKQRISENEQSNLSQKELIAFKELSKILLKLSEEDLEIAIRNGDFTEVK